MTEAVSASAPLRGGRIALAAAVLLALAAGGVKLWQSQRDDADTAALPPAGAQQPTVDEVIARLEARLKDNPDDAEGWRMLGWSYFSTERFAEAATAMKRATVLDPDNPEYFSMLGEALVMASKDGQGMPPDARAAFDKALSLDPKDARARYFRAVAMDLARDHRGALDAWFAFSPTPPPMRVGGRRERGDPQRRKENGIEVRSASRRPIRAPHAGLHDGAAVASAGSHGPTRER